MSKYVKPSREMLLDAINIENGLQDTPLTYDQIALGLPLPLETEGARRNTQLLVYGLKTGGKRGTVNLTYDRLDMQAIFRNVTPLIIADPVSKLSDLLPHLNEKYGLYLTVDDIVDRSVEDLGDSWLLTVSIKPSCVAWVSDFTLRFAKFIPNLNDVVAVKALNAINAPFTVADKPQAEYVAYGYDWSDMTTTFNAMGVGSTISATNIDLLNDVVPLKFSNAAGSSVPAGGISLLGATVLKKANPQTDNYYDPTYKTALVLKLAATSNYRGNLIFHYQPVE